MPFSRRSLLTAGTLLAAAPTTQPAAAQARRHWTSPATPATPQASVQPIWMLTGELGATFVQIGSDLADVVVAPDIELRWAGSRGSLDNVRGLLQVRGVDLGMAATDTLTYAKQRNLYSGLGRIQYIAKLYDNEVHIVAKDPKIRSIADLKGKRVNIDKPGSGTAITCGIVFAKLGIEATFSNETPQKGVAMLNAGDIDAVCYCFGKPGAIFRNATTMTGLHMVTIPYDLLQDDYLPAVFTPADYPLLVPPGQQVDSVAVGVALACFGWEPGTDRYRNLARFTQLFVQHFDELRQPPYHPKWRDVDLRATVPGWTRFAPMTQLLETAAQAAPGDAGFEEFLRSLNLSGATGPDRDRLLGVYRGLRR